MTPRPDRDPRVWLAADVTRCEPSPLPICPRDTCARYLAPLPPQGGSVADFNLPAATLPMVLGCGKWLSAQDARMPAPAPQRRVHPPLGS